MKYGETDILVGDCRAMLAELPERHFHCVVTSPPYFGLRDYGTATWVGGDAGCDHLQQTGGTASSTLGLESGGHDLSDEARVRATERSFVPYKNTCRKCGATRIDDQIGLEPTPDEFVACMVEVFRGVWRVLRDDGVMWLNLGDSYAASGKDRTPAQATVKSTLQGGKQTQGGVLKQPNKIVGGLKPKDLMNMPHRVVLALQADGWTHRDTIIWRKPAPMPGSQRDRCTSSYEFIFQLTKRPIYYFDMEAVKEKVGERTRRNTEFRGESTPYKNNASFDNNCNIPNRAPAGDDSLSGRTPRNVWTIASEGFSDAHFATFPRALPLKCIKASTSAKGCCPECGAGWVRLVEEKQLKRARPNDYVKRTGEEGTGNSCANSVAGVESRTLGWEPGCECYPDFADEPIHALVPCRVLDPFLGAGTSALAANLIGRDATGIELNPDYAEMARKRIDRELHPSTYHDADQAGDGPLFQMEPQS